MVSEWTHWQQHFQNSPTERRKLEDIVGIIGLVIIWHDHVFVWLYVTSLVTPNWCRSCVFVFIRWSKYVKTTQQPHWSSPPVITCSPVSDYPRWKPALTNILGVIQLVSILKYHLPSHPLSPSCHFLVSTVW